LSENTPTIFECKYPFLQAV